MDGRKAQSPGKEVGRVNPCLVATRKKGNGGRWAMGQGKNKSEEKLGQGRIGGKGVSQQVKEGSAAGGPNRKEGLRKCRRKVGRRGRTKGRQGQTRGAALTRTQGGSMPWDRKFWGRMKRSGLEDNPAERRKGRHKTEKGARIKNREAGSLQKVRGKMSGNKEIFPKFDGGQGGGNSAEDQTKTQNEVKTDDGGGN